MSHLILLAFAAIVPLAAASIEDFRRSEDWETHLSRAGHLTSEQRFAPADALYRSLTEAADQFEFPLVLKAKCRNNHGAMFHLSGQYADAEVKYKEAAKLWIASVGEESDEHARTLNNLGEVYRHMGRYSDAESAYRGSLAIREALVKRDQLQLATTLNNLATMNVDTAGELNLAKTLSSLGDMQRSQNRLAEAEVAFERALRIKREILGPNHPDVATSLNNLAALRQDKGDLDAAEKLYMEAVAIREAQTPIDRPTLASLLNNLGTLHRKASRFESAEKYLQRANELWGASVGAKHPKFGVGLNNLAELYLAQDRLAEAEPLFRRAIAITEVALGPNHPQTAAVFDNLGVLFMKQEKAAGAESFFRRALDARSDRFGRENQWTLESMHHLSQALELQGRYTEAERLLTEELAILEARQWTGTPHHGYALSELAFIQLAQHRFAAAERYLNEYSSFAGQLPAFQRAQLGELYQVYARMLRNDKKDRDARRIEDKASSLLPR